MHDVINKDNQLGLYIWPLILLYYFALKCNEQFIAATAENTIVILRRLVFARTKTRIAKKVIGEITRDNARGRLKNHVYIWMHSRSEGRELATAALKITYTSWRCRHKIMTSYPTSYVTSVSFAQKNDDRSWSWHVMWGLGRGGMGKGVGWGEVGWGIGRGVTDVTKYYLCSQVCFLSRWCYNTW